MSISGKRVLLTGASGGIGSHVALALARGGAHLALIGRDEARLQGIAHQTRSMGALAVVLEFDLAVPHGHEELLERAATSLGGLDVLINNAGVQAFGALADADPDALSRLVAVNLTSPLLLTRAALRHFRAGAGGHVVNVGSTFGAIGYPHFSAYSATKFALRGLSEALRRELADSAIRVTYLSPRATDTGMNGPAVREMQRKTGAHVDDPATVARAIVAAVSEAPAERQLGWPERFFVRMNAILPRVVDRALAKQSRIAEACESRHPAAGE